MAKTYSQIRTLFGKMALESSTTNLDYGVTLLNDAINRRLSAFNWFFLDKERTIATVSGQEIYQLPADCFKLKTVSVTVGSTKYPAVEVNSRQEWNLLTYAPIQGDTVQRFFVEGNTVSLYPTPATSGNKINLTYTKKQKVLGAPDYTSGTVTILSGQTTVTGIGTIFTQNMVGRSIELDSLWYEIVAVTSATSLEIVSPFIGQDQTNATFIIAEIVPFPDGFEYLPLYDALADFYLPIEGRVATADRYLVKAAELETRMKKEFGLRTKDPTSHTTYFIDNPNNYPRL